MNVDDIYKLMNLGRYDDARRIVASQLENTNHDFLDLLNLYHLKIDIGSESQNPQDLEDGLTFYIENEKEIKKHITISSYHYNRANALSGLSKLYWSANPGVKTLSEVKTHLQEPIDHFWLALNNTGSTNRDISREIRVNLANSLMTTGRSVEALNFLDIVLKEYPNFPNALISKASFLKRHAMLNNGGYSISLYFEVYSLYNKALSSHQMPPFIKQVCIRGKDEASKKLENEGFDISKSEKELKDTHKEYLSLTPYRRFCLDNFITLNEHAIHCKCIATEKDDLQIGSTLGVFKNPEILKLELLFNRIKSEFGLARWLYFRSQTAQVQEYNDLIFTELYDNEESDSLIEMLRTSFRTCYGILDKLAYGLCKFYGLATHKENILFESFWKSKEDRWTKLNEKKNLHLSAIYSIACDLNTRNGQLKEFKMWRNNLEHKVLVLKNSKKLDLDPYQLYDDDFIMVIDYESFKSKTLHLLQLTRAAIFSFAYCIRLETIEEGGDDSFAISINQK